MTEQQEQEVAPGPADQAAPRRVHVASLVAGIVFLVMAVAFAVADLDSFEAQVRVVWPSSMLAIGLGLLLGARRPGRRRKA